MTRELQKLDKHAIVCGYGRTGRQLAAGLIHEHVQFVVVDDKPDNIAEPEWLLQWHRDERAGVEMSRYYPEIAG